MKIEEALDYFKERIEYCNRYERKDLSNKYALAIAALEKQIAKKPTNDGHCPECFSDNEYPYNEEKVRYCPSCGQKLDWGKE